MKNFKHVHSSSRFDRSVESLLNATHKYQREGSIITYTEVQYEPRENALRKIEGWGFVAGDESPHNDGGILFDRSVWTLKYSENFKATNKTFFKTGGGRTQPAYATIAVLEHKETGKVIAVLVVHLPSSVEGDLSRKDSTFRTLSWFDSFSNTRKRLRAVAKAEHADAMLYIADYNVDFKKAWVRALIKTLAPRYKNAWTRTNIAGGTLGRRIIDATLMRGNVDVVGSARLLDNDASSDHRPYVEELRWT